MKYTVTWKGSLTRRLAEIWLSAPDRGAVAAAANAIDSQLGNDPWARGESRGETLRILIEGPLAVVYEVREQDRLVEVLCVRQVPSRPQHSS